MRSAAVQDVPLHLGALHRTRYPADQPIEQAEPGKYRAPRRNQRTAPASVPEPLRFVTQLRGTRLWVRVLWVCWLVFVCPVVSVGGGGEPAEGLVWPVGVVFGSPVFEHDSGFEEVGEVFGVEAFVSEASVEGLDVGVLPWRSGLDVGGVGAPDAAPQSLSAADAGSGPLSMRR